MIVDGLFEERQHAKDLVFEFNSLMWAQEKNMHFQ